MAKRRGGRSAPDAPVFLRLTVDERTRLKVAVAETRQSYAEFVMDAVARHEKRKAAAPVVAASPLHAPVLDTVADDDQW